MFETHACMNITEICTVWFGNEHVVLYTHWTRLDWFEFEIPMADIICPCCIRACNWRWWAAFSSHIYIYTPIYIIFYIFLYCVRVTLTLKDGRWMRWIRWSKMENLSTTGHWISSRFHQIRHMYNLEDSMVELKHNAQTSKHKHFFFVLESSVS